MGGVARRATVIEQVRESAEGPVLLVDAGGSLFGDALATQTEGRVSIAAMNAMGYDAMGLGVQDLSRGLQLVLDRAAEAAFPFVSVNMADAEGKLLFPAYAIVERGGLTWGIIGVSNVAIENTAILAGAVRVLDPVEMLRLVVPELRGRVDVVVVLSSLGSTADKSVLERVDGIDIVVAGQTRQLLRTHEMVGSAVLVQAGYDGEWLGRVDARWTPAGLVEAQGSIINLTPEIADDAAMVDLVEGFRQGG